jgi:hypothetical protein
VNKAHLILLGNPPDLAPFRCKIRECEMMPRGHAVVVLAVLWCAMPRAGCSEGSLSAGDQLAASQRAAVNAKMAEDERAVNAHSLGLMLQEGFSIPAILSSITQQHGIGACCQAALAIGSASGAGALQTMLNHNPGEYSSAAGGVEATVQQLGARAGTCCRSSLCTSLRSEKQCGWMGTCTWKPMQIPAAPAAQPRGVCKEAPKAELLAPRGATPVQRTGNLLQQELKEKEQELKDSDLKLAREEEELTAEKEISRLTHEAQALFKTGKFSEAKLYLEEAVRLDQSSAVTGIAGTPANPGKRQGLTDLKRAVGILDAFNTQHRDSHHTNRQNHQVSRQHLQPRGFCANHFNTHKNTECKQRTKSTNAGENQSGLSEVAVRSALGFRVRAQSGHNLGLSQVSVRSPQPCAAHRARPAARLAANLAGGSRRARRRPRLSAHALRVLLRGQCAGARRVCAICSDPRIVQPKYRM